jgi:hypothetical protein
MSTLEGIDHFHMAWYGVNKSTWFEAKATLLNVSKALTKDQ